MSFCRPEKNPPEIIPFAARCRSHGGTGRTRSHTAQQGLDGGREEPPRRCELDRSAAPAQADAGRAAHSGRRTWERIRARLRTLGSSTPAQMDIYFTLFSLFFFTQPGNKQTKPRRLSQMPSLFFCCASTFLRTNVIYSFDILNAEIFKHDISSLSSEPNRFFQHN